MRDETLQKLQMDCFVIDFATGSQEQADQPEEDEGREDPRFVQIKRQYFKSDVKAYNVIQLNSSISDQQGHPILYQRTAVEKKLLA